MSDKKNIDRLFQEKFKDFEVAPDPAVWKKIKSRQKKKRRVLVIPFWYRIGGVAALIAILVTIGIQSANDTSTKETIVDSDVDTTSNQVSPADKIINPSNTKKEDAVVSSDNAKDPSGNSNQKQTQNQIRTINTFDVQNTKETIIASTRNQQGVESKKTKTSTDPKDSYSKNKVALKQDPNPGGVKNTISQKKGIIAEKLPEKNNPLFIQPDSAMDQKQQKEAIAESNSDQKTNKEKNSIKTENTIPDDGKKSIFDVIDEQEKEETVVAESNDRDKWYITPNVAPVYYNALGNGSSIKQEFADNTKDGEFNLSYGIQVAYEISKKISVRSGVHKLDLSYNTENVGFGISSIGREGGGSGGSNVPNIIVSDFNPQSSSLDGSDIPTTNLVREQNPGELNHSLSYIEVPLEIKYDLIDKKFGVHLIGGVSTLFLNDDNLTILTNGFKSSNVLREEFNVNDVSFSGNVGLGLNYKITKQFQVNLEPMFKYQINGFKNSSEDFTPYYIGVYTGLSIKF